MVTTIDQEIARREFRANKGVPMKGTFKKEVRKIVKDELRCEMELKKLDRVSSNSSPPSLTAITVAAASGGTNNGISISDTAQGVTVDDRLGNLIRPHTIEFNLQIVPDASAVGDSYVRFILYQYHQLPAGTSNNTGGLVEVPLTPGLTSHPAWVTKGEFRILDDKIFHLKSINPQGGVLAVNTTVNSTGLYQTYKRKFNVKNYACPKSNVNVELENHYYFVIMCSDNLNPAGAHVTPGYYFYSRMIFADA